MYAFVAIHQSDAAGIRSIMGQIGVGKSHFINVAAGTGIMKEGGGLHSVTIVPKHTTCFNPRDSSNSSSIILVDSPGFNDTRDADSERIKRISNYMKKFHRQARVGVLYLIDPRQRMFPMLDELMSSPKIEESLQVVTVAITKTNTNPTPEMAFTNSEKSAWDIIETVLKKKQLVDVAVFRAFLSTLHSSQVLNAPTQSHIPDFSGLFVSDAHSDTPPLWPNASPPSDAGSSESVPSAVPLQYNDGQCDEQIPARSTSVRGTVAVGGTGAKRGRSRNRHDSDLDRELTPPITPIAPNPFYPSEQPILNPRMLPSDPSVVAHHLTLSRRTSSIGHNVGIQDISCDRGVPILTPSMERSRTSSPESISSGTSSETYHAFSSERASNFRDGRVAIYSGPRSEQFITSDADSVRSNTTYASTTVSRYRLKRILAGLRAAVASESSLSISSSRGSDDTW
ncbi:hypothetical protein BDZ97DRAFT_1867520 [Flammula alnicola]|nr:hypothetical protein BDZ97DRAFT_1867520 [Flammula alnicola]